MHALFPVTHAPACTRQQHAQLGCLFRVLFRLKGLMCLQALLSAMPGGCHSGCGHHYFECDFCG